MPCSPRTLNGCLYETAPTVQADSKRRNGVKQESLLFGEDLRRRRLAAGLTVAQLARLVHYSKSQISKVERGVKPPSRDLARLCDSVLRAEGSLVSLVRSRSGEDGLTSSRAGGGAPQGCVERWLIQLSPSGQSWIQPMSRRKIIAAGAFLIPGTFISGTAVSETAEGAAPTTIFSTLFEQYRRLGQVTDPRLLVPTLVTQTHALQELSRVSQGHSSKELLFLSSRYAEYTGWLIQETGNDSAALWWTQRAVELASAAGDSGFAAYGLVRHALVTLYRGDAATTTHLARQAQRANGSLRVRGLAALREAQGHALACDYDASMLALEQAETLLNANAKETEQPVIGTRNLSQPAEMIKGWCLYELGHPYAAAEILGQQLAAMPGDAVRARVRYGVRHALAYATAGEVDHACRLTAGLLDDAMSIRSATIATDLRVLARTLGRHQKNPCVRDLAPRLGTTLRAATP